MKLVALAALAAALAVPAALARDGRHVDRHRRPRLHDQADAGRQEGRRS